MNFTDYKKAVQAIYPITFENTLTFDQDNNAIDQLLLTAVNQVLTSVEKLVPITINSCVTHLPQAMSVPKVTPGVSNSGAWDVFQMMKFEQRRIPHIPFHFHPTTRNLTIDQNFDFTGINLYAEYVVDPEFLTVEDLTGEYKKLAIEYAVALLKIKEGGIGNLVTLTEIPFEYDYSQMKDEGTTSKESLEEIIESKKFGLFAGKAAY